jgi:hypothetical protein
MNPAAIGIRRRNVDQILGTNPLILRTVEPIVHLLLNPNPDPAGQGFFQLDDSCIKPGEGCPQGRSIDQGRQVLPA